MTLMPQDERSNNHIGKEQIFAYCDSLCCKTRGFRIFIGISISLILLFFIAFTFYVRIFLLQSLWLPDEKISILIYKNIMPITICIFILISFGVYGGFLKLVTESEYENKINMHNFYYLAKGGYTFVTCNAKSLMLLLLVNIAIYIYIYHFKNNGKLVALSDIIYFIITIIQIEWSFFIISIKTDVKTKMSERIQWFVYSFSQFSKSYIPMNGYVILKSFPWMLISFPFVIIAIIILPTVQLGIFKQTFTFASIALPIIISPYIFLYSIILGLIINCPILIFVQKYIKENNSPKYGLPSNIQCKYLYAIGITAILFLSTTYLFSYNWRVTRINHMFSYDSKRNYQSVAVLLITHPLNINSARTKGLTPLCYATVNGNISLIRALLRAGADTDARTIAKRTPLYAAIILRNINVVKILVAYGANPSAVDAYGMTPLHLAVTYKNLSIIDLLIQKRANVNAKTLKGLTPLYIATMLNNEYIVNHLINNGANVNIPDESGVYPIHIAARHNNLNILYLLIRKRAKINMQIHQTLETPLHIACENNKLETVKLLLANGAEINAQNCWGRTSLMLAIERDKNYNNFDIVKFLLEQGADVHLKDCQGYTAYSLAIVYKLPKIAQLVKQYEDITSS